jgi:hypothetical protein
MSFKLHRTDSVIYDFIKHDYTLTPRKINDLKQLFPYISVIITTSVSMTYYYLQNIWDYYYHYYNFR